MSVRKQKLAPQVNRILFVKNLPYKITGEQMYEIFGKFGAIRQIRLGDETDTRGTAYVVFEDIYDAKNACDHLSGFNVGNRYITVRYSSYHLTSGGQASLESRQEKLEQLKRSYQVAGSAQVDD